MMTFGLVYAFSENFVLPLSHDEVVYGKHSILGRMPGDEWQRFANLRLLYSYMFTHPGTNLLFQGAEFGQSEEWNFQQSLDWHLLQYAPHKGVQTLIKDLNILYKKEPALYEKQFSGEGFEWIDHGDHTNSTLSYLRIGKEKNEFLVVVNNFTPVVRHHYRIGVPEAGTYEVLLNSDDTAFGGSAFGDLKTIESKDGEWNGRAQHIEISLPPLCTIVFKKQA